MSIDRTTSQSAVGNESTSLLRVAPLFRNVSTDRDQTGRIETGKERGGEERIDRSRAVDALRARVCVCVSPSDKPSNERLISVADNNANVGALVIFGRARGNARGG